MSILVSTDIVRFVNIQEQPLQVQEISVQNTSSRPLKIRTQHINKTSYFKIDFDNKQSIAPGMSQKVKITLDADKSDTEYMDQFCFVTEGGEKVDVKLEALSKFTDLRVESQQIDMGVISVNESTQLQFPIFNQGPDEAEVYIESQQLQGYPADLTIQPSRLVIPGNKHSVVNISLSCPDPGTFHYQVKVFDKQRTSISVQVIAAVVTPSITLTNDQLELTDEFVYKTLFFEKQQQQVILSNPTPFDITYNIETVLQETSSQQKKDLGYFLVEPSQGLIKANSALNVAVTFQPKLELSRVDACNQFACHFNLNDIPPNSDQLNDVELKVLVPQYYNIRPDFDNINVLYEMQLNYQFKSFKQQQLTKLVGFAKKPLFLFNQLEFKFTDPLEQKSLLIKNVSNFQAQLKYQLPTGIHYQKKQGPREGTLLFEPKQQILFDLVYNPKASIRLNDFLHFEFGNKYFNANLPVFTNFDQYSKTIKQVDSKIATQIFNKSQTNVQKFNLTKITSNDIESIQTLKDSNKLSYNQNAAKAILTDKTHNYATKYLDKINNKTTKQVNQDTYQNNQISAYNDGLDLGIGDTAYDFNDYKPVQTTDYKLKDHTVKKIDEVEQCVEISQQPKERPALKNDITPTSKQYPKSAFENVLFTKIEQECKIKLVQRQFQIITCSNNLYDFGEVTVNTESVRYFKIANDLQQYIKIQIVPKVTNSQQGDQIQETQYQCEYTIQETQYIPAGCYTSFSLQFKFSQISPKLYEELQVMVNDTLYTTIKVNAIVTRPKLQFNARNYKLEQCHELLNKYKQRLIQISQQKQQDHEFLNQLANEVLFFELNSQNAFSDKIIKEINISNQGTSKCDIYLDFMMTNNDFQLGNKNCTLETRDQHEIKLQWIPFQDEFVTNIIEVSFEGGYQPYYLPVICKLVPGKGQIAEKQVDMGIINVSKTIPAFFTLQNKSNLKPLYYEVLNQQLNQQTDKIAVSCDTTRGEIQPDENYALNLYVDAKKVGAFSQKLPVRVIGGETLYVQIKGIVEVPKLSVTLQKPVVMELEATQKSPSRKQPERLSPTTMKEQFEQSQKLQQFQQNSSSVFKFETQTVQIADPLTAHAPHIQHLYLSNISKVTADIFVDARMSESIELLESDNTEGVMVRRVVYSELLQKLNIYAKEATIKSNQSIKLSRTASKKLLMEKSQSQMNISSQPSSKLDMLAMRYNIPLFKNASDATYEEYLNQMMNGHNLNELYGNVIQRQTEQSSSNKDGQNKILYIQIPAGKTFQLTFSITEAEGISNRIQNLAFYCLGVTTQAEIFDRNAMLQTQQNNWLNIEYRAVNSVLQLSHSKLNFGVKVADSNYKQSKLERPVTQRELFQKLVKQGYDCYFMRYAADNGLFYQDIQINNHTQNRVRFVIELENINEQEQLDYFSTSHPFGVMNAYETLQIRFYYSPVQVGVHQKVAKVYYTDDVNIRDEEFFPSTNYRTYNKLQIHIQAVAVHRSLSFSVQNIVLPNTYINVPSRAIVYIYNIGYKNTTKLQVFFPPELSKCILMIQFPWGNRINHMIKVLPLIITLVANQPMSVLTQISVLDEENIPYNLLVAGNVFDTPYSLQEYVKYNSDRLQSSEPGKPTIFNLQSESNPGVFPNIAELAVALTDENAKSSLLTKYKKYGVTQSNIQALVSIKAQPLLELSDFAKSVKLDQAYVKMQALYQNDADQFDYKYVVQVDQVTELMLKKKSFSDSRNVSFDSSSNLEPIVKHMIEGPFSSYNYQNYSQIMFKLRFFWQYQFKFMPTSEAPVTPFLMYLPDQIMLDEMDRARLSIMQVFSDQVLGLKVNNNNFLQFLTGIQNRTSGFFMWVQQMFKQNFIYQQKEIQNIPQADQQRVEFLKNGYESFLNCLKIKGAMINNVNSALLLSRKDFQYYCKQQISKQAQICFTKAKVVIAVPESERKSRIQQKQVLQQPQEISLNSQLISQSSAQLLLELVDYVHEQYHQSAWFHVFVELMRFYIVNFASSSSYISEMFKKYQNYALNEGSEFLIKSGIDVAFNKQNFIKFQEQIHQFANNLTTDPTLNLLTVLNYFTNFQLFNFNQDLNKGQLVITNQFTQLTSGLQVACLIISYILNQQIINKVIDLLSVGYKMLEIKQQRGKTDMSVLNLLNMTQKDNDITEKLMQQLDNCRINLWREVCTFLRQQFGLQIEDRVFYTSTQAVNYTINHCFGFAFTHKLLVGYLLQLLPCYLPTKIIKINAGLAETLNQKIEIIGNAKNSLKYYTNVCYPCQNNSCEVDITQKHVYLEAKQNTQIDVRIKPNFIKSCYVILQLNPVYEAAYQGAVQQANYIGLYINVIDKAERQDIVVEAKCGQLQKFAIPVDNQTTIDAKYKVSIEEVFYAIDPTKSVKNPKPGKSAISFRSDKQICVDKKATKELNLVFNPTHPGLYTANVTVQDERVGQRTYEVRGFSTLPEPAKIFKFITQSTEAKLFKLSTQELDIQFSLVDSMRYALIPINHNNGLPIQFNKEEQSFNIQIKQKTKFSNETYPYKLVVLLDNSTKVYQINIIVVKKQDETKLKFSCPARQQCEQKITIVNTDNAEAEFLVTIKELDNGPNQFVFNFNPALEHRVKIHAKQQQQYIIKFSPSWIIQCTSKITVQQTETGVIVSEFLLEGEGLQPESSGTVECKAGVCSETQMFIKIRGDNKQDTIFTLNLEDDKSKVFTLPQLEVAVRGTETVEVPINVESYMSGDYTTKLFVTNSDKTYYWYTLNAHIIAREGSGEVSASSTVGQAKEVKIELYNPHKTKQSTFYAKTQDLPHQFVNTPIQIQIGPQEKQFYVFTFTPCATGKWNGSIKFSSREVGEYWYDVKLSCDDIKAEPFNLEAQIGSSVDQVIVLKNCFDESLTYTVELSNSEAFALQNKRQTILKFQEQNDVKITYRPTKVNDSELCQVNIYGRDSNNVLLQQMRYKLIGHGIMPQEAPVVRIFAQLNQGTSGQLQFRNPFLTRASVKFQVDQSESFTFQYKDQLLDPQQAINIKYVFIPRKLQNEIISLKIVINPNFDIDNGEEFPFVYVFEGISEFLQKQPIAYMECQCRQTVEKAVPLPQEIEITDYESVKFDIECTSTAESPFENTAAAVRRALQVTWSNEGAGARTGNKIMMPLPQIGRRNLLIKFSPLKQFACDVQLVINQNEGGRYKLTISLISDAPAPEGTILVELPNGSTPGEYVFSHCNTLNVYSEFRAYFTPNSSERFSVTPTTGILEPSQQTGIATVSSGKTTQFTVVCQTGTNNARGQLVVETKDIVFFWDVVSGYKKYVPPIGTSRSK